MKIALVQQHSTADRNENLARGVEAFREAARQGVDLVAFSELAFLRFLPQRPATQEALAVAEPIPGPTTETFVELCREHGIVAVLNLFERCSIDGKTYDSSPVIDADGRLVGVTRMAHIMEGPGFHEKGYYAPSPEGPRVYETAAGRVGVAICYDRHFPEYLRALGLSGAEIVVVPQAGAVGEWTEGIFEAELQVAAFQNGYFAALVNRVGREEVVYFAGESYVVDPDGRVIARAPRDRDCILYADCDLSRIASSFARKHFLPDRRPRFYRSFGIIEE
ncbi:MAG: nitrilase-related carbon-nitrogen hydrolase [Clostridiales bacterium]|nr:nitrilase-related carbon-nitrogen hydrolase [Clostridiales bacterium]